MVRSVKGPLIGKTVLNGCSGWLDYLYNYLYINFMPLKQHVSVKNHCASLFCCFYSIYKSMFNGQTVHFPGSSKAAFSFLRLTISSGVLSF